MVDVDDDDDDDDVDDDDDDDDEEEVVGLDYLQKSGLEVEVSVVSYCLFQSVYSCSTVYYISLVDPRKVGGVIRPTPTTMVGHCIKYNGLVLWLP